MKISLNNKLLILLVFVGLVAFAVTMRLLPHPPNFAPIAAIAIFSGALLPRRYAYILPLVAMIISDIFIGLHPLVYATWGSFALIAIMAEYTMRGPNISKMVGTTLAGSLIFFVISNFAVWAQGTMYSQNFAGLVQCYYNALPFFRNTAMGDLTYVAILFGAYFIVKIFAKQLKYIYLGSKA